MKSFKTQRFQLQDYNKSHGTTGFNLVRKISLKFYYKSAGLIFIYLESTTAPTIVETKNQNAKVRKASSSGKTSRKDGNME